MSDLNNIDKLLKDSFADFTPDAPDVWQGIEQGVQAAQAGQIVATVKGTSLVVKIIATVVISASVVTGYLLLTKDSEPQTPKAAEAVASISPPEETPVAVSQPDPVTTTPQQEIRVTNNAKKTGSQPAKEDKETSTAVQHLRLDDAEQPHPDVQPKAPGTAVKTPESTGVPVNSSQVVVKDNGTQTPPAISKENLAQTPPRESGITDDSQRPTEPLARKQENLVEPTIPNTFSPNGDGLNDKFVVLIEDEEFYSLTIMDRNGKQVFESTDKNIQWDGKDYKTGAACPAGNYYRVFRYKLKGAQFESKTTGIIVLVN